MDNYFKVYQKYKNIYLIKDHLGVFSTLIVGSEKSLLIDTGYGIGNLYQEVLKITDKELIVVNSHGHMDHTNGNYQFKEVFIHRDDYELLKSHNAINIRKRNLKKIDFNIDEEFYLNQTEGNIKFIEENHQFCLGDKNVSCLSLKGHTKGSLAFYLEKEKLMITSDGLCPYIWLFLNESSDIRTYINSIQKILEYDFDYFITGHSSISYTKKQAEEFLEVSKNIDLTKITKMNIENFEYLNPYCYTKTFPYDPNGCGVIFDPNKF